MNKSGSLHEAPKAKPEREAITFVTLSGLWCRGDLASRYPDHVRPKKTVAEDARRLQYLIAIRMPDGATFGERRVADITLDDCEHVMACLPSTTESSSTRRHYAQTIRRLLAIGVYPMRLRESLPIPQGWLPSARNEKAKAWLYPSEDTVLMKCTEVPLARRIFFGILVREGLRVSELRNLAWADVDLQRGVIKLDSNKTDDPRTWALGADVVATLRWWRRAHPDDEMIFTQTELGDHGDFAYRLREALRLAGVTRTELFEPQPNRLLLRAHDLRGTFVTLALAIGKTEAWVTDRTGHRSSAMIYNYKRGARTAGELGLGWFMELHQTLPELRSRRGGAS